MIGIEPVTPPMISPNFMSSRIYDAAVYLTGSRVSPITIAEAKTRYHGAAGRPPTLTDNAQTRSPSQKGPSRAGPIGKQLPADDAY